MAADVSILDQFKDVKSISSWAREDAAWCVEKGIINGSNGNFNPQNSLTREQICSMLHRTYNTMYEAMKAAIEELKTNLPVGPNEPVKDFTEDIEKLKSDVNVLNTKIADLDSVKKSMQTLTETYDTIAKQYDDLTKNFKDVMDNVNALKLLITSLKIPEAPDISEYEKIAEDLGNQVSGLQTKFDENMSIIETKIESITTEVKSYVDNKVAGISGGSGTVEIPDEIIQSMIDAVTQNVLTNLSDKITVTDAVLNEIKASIETITSDLTAMGNQIKELSEDIIEIQPIPEEDDELIVDMDEDPNQPEG